ncbi:hypothetical protein F5148DRAFT_325934 [Russula earlei]|uniref:Uncharacterized protein n=1 Tax=Russula earlei TaxID=71964 RepID=A0ACC0UIQ9_9AGAM|nr:hypothetical protein F5148DRAFT_325934 [Russula earlei]
MPFRGRWKRKMTNTGFSNDDGENGDISRLRSSTASISWGGLGLTDLGPDVPDKASRADRPECLTPRGSPRKASPGPRGLARRSHPFSWQVAATQMAHVRRGCRERPLDIGLKPDPDPVIGSRRYLSHPIPIWSGIQHPCVGQGAPSRFEAHTRGSGGDTRRGREWFCLAHALADITAAGSRWGTSRRAKSAFLIASRRSGHKGSRGERGGASAQTKRKQ